MIPAFLQGCGADIKPYITADNGRFKSCSYDELEEAGIYTLTIGEMERGNTID